MQACRLGSCTDQNRQNSTVMNIRTLLADPGQSPELKTLKLAEQHLRARYEKLKAHTWEDPLKQPLFSTSRMQLMEKQLEALNEKIIELL